LMFTLRICFFLNFLDRTAGLIPQKNRLSGARGGNP
jgi:hypothetical protein